MVLQTQSYRDHRDNLCKIYSSTIISDLNSNEIKTENELNNLYKMGMTLIIDGKKYLIEDLIYEETKSITKNHTVYNRGYRTTGDLTISHKILSVIVSLS